MTGEGLRMTCKSHFSATCYHAVKGVDEHENPEPTAADLIRHIRENCHAILVDRILADKYWTHISRLTHQPSLQTETSLFVTEFLANSSKMVEETSDPPELPNGVKVPREDEYVVRAALISHPVVVTAEERLRKSINSQPELGLKAISPAEARELAKET